MLKKKKQNKKNKTKKKRNKSTVPGVTLTPRNTTRDAFINKYIRVRELILRFSQEVSLELKLPNCKRNNNLEKTHPSTPGLLDCM